MGCDIHLYTDHFESDAWNPADVFVRDQPDEDNPVGCLHTRDDEFYEGRNYNLFAILADVRNGNDITPIAAPRGVPTDATAEYQEIVKQWGGDGHSHSFFTLRELLDFNWQTTAKDSGWCSFDAWQKWAAWGRRHGEPPAEYCRGVSGQTVRHLNAAEMDKLTEEYHALRDEAVRRAFLSAHHNDHGLAEWTHTYAKMSGAWWGETMPRLISLAGGVAGVDAVRVCFFFDN